MTTVQPAAQASGQTSETEPAAPRPSGAYYRIRTGLIRAARRIPGMRALARAVLADEVGNARTRLLRRGGFDQLDIPPGRFFAEGRGRNLPTIALVCTGMAAGDAERVAAAVEQAQYLTGSFRPLFVVDSAELSAFRSRGHAVEHLMSEDDFHGVEPSGSYPEYLTARMTSISRSYGVSGTVPLQPDALPDPVMLRMIGFIAR
ncbi:MAG TPA: hypothetical protein VIP77_21455 [Jiangellaceae bacterium]